MTIIKLTRKNGDLYHPLIGKVKVKNIFPPEIIRIGMYNSKDDKETINELECNLIKKRLDANAYEIGEEDRKNKAIHALGVYKIKNSSFRKATGTNLIKEIIENLFGDF